MQVNIAKPCVIPVCKNQRFNLVHKFPSDKERFAEWSEIIQKPKKIDQFHGLTEEGIRKRYFICCRHFSMNQYKNIESRSLNVTAVPNLNLSNLDDIQLSKAWQVEDNSENFEEPQEIVVKQVVQNVRILNTGVAVKESPKNLLKVVVKRSASVVELNEEIKFDDSFETLPESFVEPQTKKPKFEEDSSVKDSEATFDNLVRKQQEKPPTFQVKLLETKAKLLETKAKLLEIKVKPTPKPAKRSQTPKKLAKKTLKHQKEQTQEEDSNPPANKLLALIEVTPEQYEKLSKSLTSAERSDQISSLITFIDKDGNEPNSIDNEITVNIDDDRSLQLDLFWLRDHCRCENCYSFSNYQRKVNILDIPDNISVESYKVEEEKLEILWNDGHKSSYDLDFLTQNETDFHGIYQEISLWNNEIIEEPLKTTCRVSMRDYMTDPSVSKKVLQNLHVYGIAFIDGVQATQQNTEFVIRELFPVHKTFFGEMWTFSDALDHSDTAYTNFYLGPHNDNTYFNDASGLQILHCIQHSGTGGENFLIDGFQVVQKIKENQPEVFERLTKTIVTAEFIENGRHHKHSAPIISLDVVTGKVSQIRFNLTDRAPMKTVAKGKIRQFYADLKVLTRELENLENRITFKLQPGTVMIFNNWRVLHGRMSYTGKRTMTGCYVARSEFQSALRVNRFID